MRLVSVPVNKEVVSLTAGDFNGDGKPDLAFYGNPAELVVLFNRGKGRFDNADAKRITITRRGRRERHTSLTVGDLNRDGRDDLALLGANELTVVYQGEKGKLGEPERLPHTATSPRMLRAVDLDGDGGDDLVILDGGHRRPGPGPVLGRGGEARPRAAVPRRDPARDRLRATSTAGPGSEFLTVENQSSRAKVLTLDEAAVDDAGQRGRLIFYPLAAGRRRGTVRWPWATLTATARSTSSSPTRRTPGSSSTSSRASRGWAPGQTFPGARRRPGRAARPTSTATARPRSSSSPSRRSRSAGASWPTAV